MNKLLNRKPKVKKIKTEADKKERMSSLAFSGIALLLTAAVFLGLLFLQNSLTNNIIYQQVIVAKGEIPEGTLITKENAEDFFTVKNVNVLDATSGYMTDITPVLGFRLKVPMCEGEIVSSKDFVNSASYTEGIENPVEVAVSIENIADADGGRVRAGDLVNFTMMFAREQLRLSESFTTGESTTASLGSIRDIVSDFESDEEADEEEADSEEGFEDLEAPDSESDDGIEFDTEPGEQTVTQVEGAITSVTLPPMQLASGEKVEGSDFNFEFYSRYVAQNLYVADALDASGTSIAPGDTVTPASILVFVIDKSDEPEFNNALANCKNKRVSKVMSRLEDVSSPTITVEETSEPVEDAEQ